MDDDKVRFRMKITDVYAHPQPAPDPGDPNMRGAIFVLVLVGFFIACGTFFWLGNHSVVHPDGTIHRVGPGTVPRTGPGEAR